MLRFAQSEQAKDEQELERATVESDEKRAEYEMALSEYSIVLWCARRIEKVEGVAFDIVSMCVSCVVCTTVGAGHATTIRRA